MNGWTIAFMLGYGTGFFTFLSGWLIFANRRALRRRSDVVGR